MLGRVSLINPKLAEVPLEELTPANTIHTYVYDPSVPAESGPGILTPQLRVALTLKSFDRFTQTTPPGALGPTLGVNPFIGPDPLAALEGTNPPPTLPPGITVRLGASELVSGDRLQLEQVSHAGLARADVARLAKQLAEST